MTASEGRDAPVKTKAIVVDPRTMTVVWANEAAAAVPGDAAEAAIPLAGQLGVTDAIVRVAATGEPYHAHADVIPTRRGSMVIVISVYRLPEGSVLVLAENAWQHTVSRKY